MPQLIAPANARLAKRLTRSLDGMAVRVTLLGREGLRIEPNDVRAIVVRSARMGKPTYGITGRVRMWK
jgi:hypothetical protein